MSKTRTCFLCVSEFMRKRDIVCAKCWNGLGQARRDAISLAPYPRDEKGQKFLKELLTCDLKVLNQMVAEHKVKPESFKTHKDESFLEMEAVFTEINAGKGT